MAGDAPSAIDELLATHAGTAVPLDELRVAHAELQVRPHHRSRGRTP